MAGRLAQNVIGAITGLFAGIFCFIKLNKYLKDELQCRRMAQTSAAIRSLADKAESRSE